MASRFFIPRLKHDSHRGASTHQSGSATLPGVTYAERLRAAMERGNVSTGALAKQLGVSYQAVRQVLIGSTKSLTAENTAKASAYLGVESLWLATGRGEMIQQEHSGVMALSNDERDLVIALRLLPQDDREQLRATVMERAKTQLELLESILQRQAAPRSANVVPIEKTRK